jgi:hypothetical protein
MRRLGAVLLVAAGAGMVVLGLLFLMAAGARPHRYAVAVGLLAIGGALAGVGVRLFKQAEAASPEQLRAEILALAKQRGGELGEADLAAALGQRVDGAPAVMTALEGERACRRTLDASGRPRWVFDELLPRLMVARCEYCQAELPLNHELATCPKCGGTLKTGLERRALDGAYRMDE